MDARGGSGEQERQASEARQRGVFILVLTLALGTLGLMVLLAGEAGMLG